MREKERERLLYSNDGTRTHDYKGQQ